MPRRGLSADGLPGTWSIDAQRTITIAAAPGSLDRIQVDRESFAVDLDRAPAGLDVLLVPEHEKAPSWALDLERTPCGAPGAGPLFRLAVSPGRSPVRGRRPRRDPAEAGRAHQPALTLAVGSLSRPDRCNLVRIQTMSFQSLFPPPHPRGRGLLNLSR